MKCNYCENQTDNTSGICDNHNKWQRVCPVCGKSFETKYIIKKYCCSRCCYKANYKYGKEPETKITEYSCQDCGRSLKKSREITIYKDKEYAVWRCDDKECGCSVLILSKKSKKNIN